MILNYKPSTFFLFRLLGEAGGKKLFLEAVGEAEKKSPYMYLVYDLV